MDAFIGSIMMFAGNFAPRGWALCEGQLLSISQNTALFSLLGTTYGGNGQTTFALPDLRGRVPVQAGQGPGLSNVDLGESAGVETVTLTQQTMPAHTHTAVVSVHANTSNQETDTPTNNYLGGSSGRGTTVYTATAPDTTLNAGAVTAQVGSTGGNQPFPIRQPYLGINFIICMEGIYPSRN
jgi:microcystin-dependent protein